MSTEGISKLNVMNNPTMARVVLFSPLVPAPSTSSDVTQVATNIIRSNPLHLPLASPEGVRSSSIHDSLSRLSDPSPSPSHEMLPSAQTFPSPHEPWLPDIDFSTPPSALSASPMPSLSISSSSSSISSMIQREMSATPFNAKNLSVIKSKLQETVRQSLPQIQAKLYLEFGKGLLDLYKRQPIPTLIPELLDWYSKAYEAAMQAKDPTMCGRINMVIGAFYEIRKDAGDLALALQVYQHTLSTLQKKHLPNLKRKLQQAIERLAKVAEESTTSRSKMPPADSLASLGDRGASSTSSYVIEPSSASDALPQSSFIDSSTLSSPPSRLSSSALVYASVSSSSTRDSAALSSNSPRASSSFSLSDALPPPSQTSTASFSSIRTFRPTSDVVLKDLNSIAGFINSNVSFLEKIDMAELYLKFAYEKLERFKQKPTPIIARQIIESHRRIVAMKIKSQPSTFVVRVENLIQQFFIASELLETRNGPGDLQLVSKIYQEALRLNKGQNLLGTELTLQFQLAIQRVLGLMGYKGVLGPPPGK